MLIKFFFLAWGVGGGGGGGGGGGIHFWKGKKMLIKLLLLAWAVRLSA